MVTAKRKFQTDPSGVVFTAELDAQLLDICRRRITALETRMVSVEAATAPPSHVQAVQADNAGSQSSSAALDVVRVLLGMPAAKQLAVRKASLAERMFAPKASDEQSGLDEQVIRKGISDRLSKMTKDDRKRLVGEAYFSRGFAAHFGEC